MKKVITNELLDDMSYGEIIDLFELLIRHNHYCPTSCEGCKYSSDSLDIVREYIYDFIK
jgi:hypothetical protein